MDNRRFVKKIKSLWGIRALRHLFYWIIAYASFYFTVYFYDSSELALKVSSSVVLPAPVPVYLHFFALKALFKKRKYLLYCVATLAIIAGAGFFMEYVFHLIMNEPGSQTSGPLTSVFLIVFTTGGLYFSQGQKQQYLLQEEEFKRIQTELILLKSQLHPHFLFNTLNNLYALSMEKSEMVPEVILKLSDLMRYVLDCSKLKTVSLEKETKFIENYMELEKLRISGQRDVTFHVTGDVGGLQISPMLLVPFVENAFKHGMNASVDEGFIHIKMNIHDKKIGFTVENSRPKAIQNHDDSSSKIGLENVRRRLELHYPHSHDLKINSDRNTYSVELNIEL